jgi:hypothetical protein
MPTYRRVIGVREGMRLKQHLHINNQQGNNVQAQVHGLLNISPCNTTPTINASKPTYFQTLAHEQMQL